MNVTLTKELESLVQSKVRSGRYADASDIVRDALRRLEQEDEYESPALEAALLEGGAVRIGLTARQHRPGFVKQPRR